MTNSNQSNTPENPATLLNTSGSSDLKAAGPGSQASSNPEELSIDDLDLATLERLSAPDVAQPESAAVEPVSSAPEAEAQPEGVTSAQPGLTVTEDTVIAGADNTDPVSVNMMFDDEPRIQFDNSETQAQSAPESAGVEPQAQAAVSAAETEAEPGASDLAAPEIAAEAAELEPAPSVEEASIPEPSVIADTSYSGDDPADAINGAPLSAEPALEANPLAEAAPEPAVPVAEPVVTAPAPAEAVAPAPAETVAPAPAEAVAPAPAETVAPAPQPVAPAPVAPAAAAVPSNANIMGGATMMNAGHTAIMGLENRQVIHREKADLSGISDADRAAIERINALNSRNRGKKAPAPAAAPAVAPVAAPEPAVAATGTTLTGSAAAGGANIMGGATMMNAGHTAIMGLENRRVAKPKGNTSTLITGISEEDLATLQKINAQNARHRSQWAQAQAKFHAEIAAERAQAQESGNALDVPGYITPHGHAEQQEAAALNAELAAAEPLEGTSTLIYGAGAGSVGQSAQSLEAQPATVITGLAPEDGSGASLARNRLRQALAADQNQTAQFDADNFNEYDEQALTAEFENGIAGAVESIDDEPSESFATAAAAQEIMEVPPQEIAGAHVGVAEDTGDAFTAQGSSEYGLSGSLGSALDDEPSLGAGVFAGAEPDDLVPGRNLGNANSDDYAGIVGDASRFKAAAQRPTPKVSSPIVTEENAPQIGLMDNEDVQRLTAQTPDLETKIVVNPEPYYDDGAATDYTPAYPSHEAYPSSNTFDGQGGYSQGPFAPDVYPESGLYGAAEPDTSAFDGVVAPAKPHYEPAPKESDSPYITPGVRTPEVSDNTEPHYVVGQSESPAPVASDGPGYTVGPKVSSQDLAAQAGDTVYVVGSNNRGAEPEVAVAEDEPPLYAGTYADKLAREQAMRERAAAAVAVERTPELDRKADQSMPPRRNDPAAAMMDAGYYEDELSEAEALAAALKKGVADSTRTPSGMGDGVLSQFSPTPATQAEPDDVPRYVVGPKRKSMPQPLESESDNSGPLYVVGPEITNAEVESHLQSERSKLSHEMALPPSYLDDESNEDAQVSDNGYEQELKAAVAESMAPPKSAAVDIGRKLAAEGMRQDREALEQDEARATEGRADSAYGLSGSDDQGGELYTGSENAEAGEALRQDSTELDAMPRTEHVKLSMAVFLFLRQLIASFFTHTTLPVVTPHLALRLGPCYPSSMAIPFFVVGLLVGALGGFIKEYTPLQMAGTTSCLVFVLLTGLSPYRGIYRIFTFITRRRHDAVMMASSVMVSLLVFIGLISTLVHVCSGVGEFTLAFALASMLSAATASTLMWNFPQDPMDSCGTMTNKGLVWVMIMCGVATFGLLHYIVALSILGVGIVMRLIFGYCIAKNQGTAQRPYVSALQLLTLFAILLDLILLKSQNYEFLNLETLTWLEHHAERLTGLAY